MNRFFAKRTRQVSFRRTWDQLRVSFWFTPLIMALFAILFARFLYAVDTRIPNEVLENRRFIIAGSPAELRTVLIGMATTTLATAGVVFSLLTLPLSTVAAQFGSRLLRIYLRDRTTQFVLGMFTGTFSYCLFTALALPPSDQLSEMPQVTAMFSLIIFTATFGSLIALIHHISTALQAPNIVASAGAELNAVVHAIIAESDEIDPKGLSPKGILPREIDNEQAYTIETKYTGYIQSIDPVRVFHLANAADLTIRFVRKPGHFVREGDPIAMALPADHVTQPLAAKIRRAFLVGRQRTPTQDFEYAVNQLSEVALRAMSPAINDPFTAMTCLDYIGAGLALFVEQDDPPSSFYDSNGRLRLSFEPTSFRELLAAAFDMLRHASCNNASVLSKILDTIGTIARPTRLEERRRELLQHVEMVRAESEASHLISADKLVIQRRCDELVNTLSSPIMEGRPFSSSGGDRKTS